jgi:hypothetical protein
MLRMNQIDEIKELQRQGLGPQEIAGRLKLNRKTAAKYMKVEDFNWIGGVPRRIVFDNASGVGRRVRDKVSLNDLFLRFKCHYGFSVSFCNPDAVNGRAKLTPCGHRKITPLSIFRTLRPRALG